MSLWHARRGIIATPGALYGGSGGPPAFDITALSDIVAVYDAAQGTFVERTGGGSTPSSVDGVVGTWRNLVSGGSAYHGQSSSDSNRPLLRNGSGKAWLDFDGAGDDFLTAWPIAKYSFAAAVRVTSGQTGYKAIAATDDSSNVGSSFYARVNTNWGTYGGGNRPANTNITDSADHVIIMDGGSSGSFYLDGASDGTYSATEGQAATAAYIGGGVGGQHTAMRLYGFAIRAAAWGSDRADVEAWLDGLMP